MYRLTPVKEIQNKYRLFRCFSFALLNRIHRCTTNYWLATSSLSLTDSLTSPSGCHDIRLRKICVNYNVLNVIYGPLHKKEPQMVGDRSSAYSTILNIMYFHLDFFARLLHKHDQRAETTSSTVQVTNSNQRL